MSPPIKQVVIRWELVFETAIMTGIVGAVSYIGARRESDPVQVLNSIDSILSTFVIVATARSKVNPSLNRHDESRLNVSVAEVTVPHHGIGTAHCEISSSCVCFKCSLTQFDLRLSVSE